ncbi:isochorismatase family protein [Flavobacteriaceae bacterium R38]|nr:isochorismatase family protein [Flavobacteriaceae bacterium R38]
MSNSRTALVLIETQNDFLSPEGKLNSLVKDVVDGNNFKQNVNEAIAAARQAGIPVYFVPIQFSKNHVEVGNSPYGILKVVKDHNAFEKGTWGAQLYDEIDVQEEDIIVEGKSSISAFSGTDLDHILRSNGVDKVILGGFLSHVCVNATMTDAYDKGYKVVTLTDAVATAGEDAQKQVIDHIYPMFSTPMDVKTFIGSITQN